MFVELLILTVVIVYIVKTNKKLLNIIKYHYEFYLIVINSAITNDKNEIFNKYIKLTQTYKSPNKIYSVHLPHVYVDQPADMKIVFDLILDRPYIYSFSNLETGLVSAKEKEWKVHRRLLNPSFNLGILKSFVPIFNEKALICVQNLNTKINNGPFDLCPELYKLSLDSICATSFGWNNGVQQGEHKHYLEAANHFPDVIFSRILSPLLHIDFFYKRTKLYLRQMKYFQHMYDMSEKAIASKRREYNNQNMDDNIEHINTASDETNYNKPQVLVNQLFNLFDNGKITEKSLFEHCDTMIAAGTETTANTLSNTILLLAMHPEVQDRVLEEIKQVFPDEDSFISYDNIAKLDYMDRVIKESLRLIPVLPFTARQATSDVTLNNNFLIKNGTIVIILMINLHYNADIWGPNVNKFDPDNFLPHNIAARPQYSYFPFGGGPHICIGQRYAMIALKIFLTKILRQFRFTTEQKLEDIRFLYGVTLKLLTKHYVEINKR